MSSDEIKSDRKYTKDHEWAMRDGEVVLVGISGHAVDQLGDITLVNVDVAVGDEVEVGKPFGTVESVKTLADLFVPLAGTVARINEQLEDEPEKVNDDCYGAGWIIAIKPADDAQYDGLLDADGYRELLA